MPEIPVGTTPHDAIRFCIEREGSTGPVVGPVVDIAVEDRDWPVTDEHARHKEAEALLGPITEANHKHAMWFLSKTRNAAALAVFRPHMFDGLGDGPVPGQIASRDSRLGDVGEGRG